MPLPRPLADVLWAVQFRFNNRFRRRLTVLKCDTTGRAAGAPDAVAGGVTVVGYGPDEALPADVTSGLAGRFGMDFPAVQRAEAAEGATLWVGSIPGEHGGEPLGFARTRPGDRAPGWHEALGPDDRLVYAMATHRAARGRGISTAILRAALAAAPPGGAAWADTMVWNAPALAVLRRVGFVDLYEADPLPDHPD
ncbi:GNAT family N-acetyltransferase [Alienimonas californiensis]|uniref:Acetyltransferase (GNAT) family protein n=1 Tax=Alienimonas californiensis TaxID=2527989 RepID=A0A517P6Z7_9PLAN|nr:GNAT family N-acetyltransferase [Alienimonas californiensis]QDT15146.1 Acetyltransferase (GNAT) family protein [Alienimonas californiensis]